MNAYFVTELDRASAALAMSSLSNDAQDRYSLSSPCELVIHCAKKPHIEVRTFSDFWDIFLFWATRRSEARSILKSFEILYVHKMLSSILDFMTLPQFTLFCRPIVLAYFR